jgi:large subunit ribosomal protein L2
MIPLSLDEISAVVGGTVTGDGSVKVTAPAVLDSREAEPGGLFVAFAGEHADVKPGNAMPLANIPVGTIVHNVELKIGKGGQIARSAGSYAQIVGRDGDYVILRLSSTEQRLVHGRCMGSIGAVSNPDNMNTTIGKAGRQRWRGRMPHNRGISMNPVDHPHGGRTNGGGNWVTPWGFPTKGKKTRKNKRTTKFIVASRHDRKKKQS